MGENRSANLRDVYKTLSGVKELFFEYINTVSGNHIRERINVVRK